MRVQTSFNGPSVELGIRLDPEDVPTAQGQWRMGVELITDQTRVELPEKVNPHPDLIGLTVLMILRPWASQRLRLNTPVSSTFASVVEREFGVTIERVDDYLKPRERGSRAGLAYSAGPDCLAAAQILGLQMPLFHFVRSRHPVVPNRATHHRGDVLVEIVRQARQRDYELWETRSDLEFLTLPFPTFAHWVTMCVGAVLQADTQELGAIVFGRHIAGTYVHSGHYFDLRSDWDQAWRRVFDAAGIDLTIPTSTLTEVGTTRVAQNHELFDHRRSCLLGSESGPCNACEKCLRKSLVESSLQEFSPNWDVIEKCSHQEKVVSKFQRVESMPQKHLYAYFFSRLPELRETFLKPAFDVLIEPPETTQWVERYYPRGICDYIPERWRARARANIERRVDPMTAEQIKQVESWPEPLSRVPTPDI